MLKLCIRRFLLLLLQLSILSFVVFFIVHAVHIIMWVTDSGISMAEAQVYLPSLRDLTYAYWNWLVGIITRGDFGWSWRLQMPAMEAIGVRLFNMIRLSLVALLLVYGIGIPLGIISGRHSGTWIDRTIQMITQIGASFPSFTVALLLILYLGFHLGWFPTRGSLPPGMAREAGFIPYHMGRLRHVMMPAISLAVIQLITPMKYLRSGIIDTEQQDFVILARAKGAREAHVFKKHIFKNSLISLVGSFPIQISIILTGTIIIESIFSFPGLGEMFLTAFFGMDTDLLKSIVLVFGSLILLGAFISDVLLMAIDPRVKIDE